MIKPRVTVFIPTYKQGPHLFQAALNSLVAQTYSEWEGIIVDDGPEDIGCGRIVASYNDERLSYVRNMGSHGIGEAWNLCLSLARREFHCFLHSDDELDADYLRTMLRMADDEPQGTLYACDVTVVDGQGEVIYPLADWVKQFIAPRAQVATLTGSVALRRLMIGDFVFCPTLFYRTDKVSGQFFSTEYRFVLDLDFICNVLFERGVLVISREKLYRYRRLGEGTTQIYTTTGYRFDEELSLHRSISRRAAASGDRALSLLSRLAFGVRAHILYRVARDAYHGCWRLALSNLQRLFSW